MKTWCERQGQVEVGVIEHEGHTFAAFGASVQGRHITGYTALKTRDIYLTTWCGKTMLACRSEVVEEYHDGALVLMFRLTKGMFIVGYALGERGMLFRGELLTGCTDDEARRTARQIAEHFSELDAQDEYEFDMNQTEDERLLDIEYRCPECGHEWNEQWSCACDSECPICGTKNITALSWEESDE
jgi:predicted Zn-ribbon and HTH transcriptional regulator